MATNSGSTDSMAVQPVAEEYKPLGTYNDAALKGTADEAAINSLKVQWERANAAGDTALADSLHQQAEAIRKNYGYSGGEDGSEYYMVEKPKQPMQISVPQADTAGMKDMVNQMSEAQKQQTQLQVDRAVAQEMEQLRAAERNAATAYQDQRDAIAIEERNALDNSALYSEVRGDKGGIGQTQYNEIQNNAAQNRYAVSQAQQKLATDTSKQIADLRAQGEFEKADALLTIAQNQLSQLIALEQWAAEYNLSAAQFAASLAQWEQEMELAIAQTTGSFADGTPTLEAKKYNDSLYSNLAGTLMSYGIGLTDEQIAAMGLTPEQATELSAAMQLEQLSGKGGYISPTAGDPELATPAEIQAATQLYNEMIGIAERSGLTLTAYLKQMTASSKNGSILGSANADAYLKSLAAAYDADTAEPFTMENMIDLYKESKRKGQFATAEDFEKYVKNNYDAADWSGIDWDDFEERVDGI